MMVDLAHHFQLLEILVSSQLYTLHLVANLWLILVEHFLRLLNFEK